MSTLKVLMLATMAASSFVSSHVSIPQIGPHPIKLTGPSYITSMRPSWTMPSKPMPNYTYKVTMDQTSTVDQVITITESAHIFQHPQTVVVAAGTLEKGFQMTPIDYGTTTLTASNGSGSVSMDITVEP